MAAGSISGIVGDVGDKEITPTAAGENQERVLSGVFHPDNTVSGRVARSLTGKNKRKI
jgi:hypothetical protein